MGYGWKLMGLALAASLMLTGCGGGGTSTAGPTAGGQTAVTAVGRISAFGSVFVNGVEYETNHAAYDVDGMPASDDRALSVGMVVRVKGTRDDQGHGNATEIRYANEIEGPVANVTVDPTDSTIKRFTIFGLAVLANATTVFRGENGTSYTFADLANGDHVEVSGDFDGDTLIATFVERKTGDAFEAKGTVSGLSGSTFVLTLHGGSTLSVTLAAGATLPAGLQDGALAEVHGTIPDASKPQDMLASAVQLDDHDDFNGDGRSENEDEADVSGVLKLDGAVWSVRGVELKFSSTTKYRPASLAAAITDGTAAGLRVHLSGPIVDGVLQVQHIRADGRADGAGELKLAGFVSGVTTDSGTGTTTIKMSFAPATGAVDVLVNAQTLLMNDDHTSGADLKNLTPGVSFLHVRGHLDSTGAFIAGALEIENRAEGYEVEGAVDTGGFVQGVSISVLGVKFMLDSGTQLRNGAPTAGDVVEVVDGDRNGFADSVEVHSQTSDSEHRGEFAAPDNGD